MYSFFGEYDEIQKTFAMHLNYWKKKLSNVPDLTISTFSNPGMHLNKSNCLSAGKVQDKPLGYVKSLSSPSGSNQTWWVRPPNLKTFDSILGQYRGPFISSITCLFWWRLSFTMDSIATDVWVRCEGICWSGSIHTFSFMNEKGIGGLSPSCLVQTLKLIVFVLNRGGVPVFSLPIRRSREAKVSAKPTR